MQYQNRHYTLTHYLQTPIIQAAQRIGRPFARDINEAYIFFKHKTDNNSGPARIVATRQQYRLYGRSGSRSYLKNSIISPTPPLILQEGQRVRTLDWIFDNSRL